jgi:hypothetical protein
MGLYETQNSLGKVKHSCYFSAKTSWWQLLQQLTQHFWTRWSTNFILPRVSYSPVLPYSFDQRVQKCCVNCWSSCHRRGRIGFLPAKSGSGKATNGRPIKKWPAVSGAGSSGSDDTGVKGREFKIATTLVSWDALDQQCGPDDASRISRPPPRAHHQNEGPEVEWSEIGSVETRETWRSRLVVLGGAGREQPARISFQQSLCRCWKRFSGANLFVQKIGGKVSLWWQIWIHRKWSLVAWSILWNTAVKT